MLRCMSCFANCRSSRGDLHACLACVLVQTCCCCLIAALCCSGDADDVGDLLSNLSLIPEANRLILDHLLV